MKIIFGGPDESPQICIEKKGHAKCPMCYKDFNNLVEMMNHLILARENSVNVLGIAMGLPESVFHVDQTNHHTTLVRGNAINQNNLQPAGEENIPISKRLNLSNSVFM